MGCDVYTISFKFVHVNIFEMFYIENDTWRYTTSSTTLLKASVDPSLTVAFIQNFQFLGVVIA